MNHHPLIFNNYSLREKEYKNTSALSFPIHPPEAYTLVVRVLKSLKTLKFP